jgi:hypothetical protein
MKIIKKRVINVETYLSTIRNDEEFHIAFNGFNERRERIQQIGFSNNPQVGEQILPAIIGSVTRFNANGSFILRRELPKETYYIARLWKWKDFQGNEYEKIIYIPRERYHREPIAPPSEELLIDSYGQNNIVVSRAFKNEPQSFEAIKNMINIFLEIFGECDLIRENYEPFLYDNVTRLNWRILPQGDYPWPIIRNLAQERIARQPRGNQPVIANQLEIITTHVPNFVAVGEGGFSDYIVFGFREKNIYILESIRVGNATYIFGNNWEVLSRMTKAEILNNNLHLERIFHSPNWEHKINQILA